MRRDITRTCIIAEAGVNHNGRLDLAIELVEVAAQIGADAVKFQTFRAADLATATAGKAAYQHRTTDGRESQLAMLARLELDASAHRVLLARCRELGLEFLSSPFDQRSADLLTELGVGRLKIPSGEITNLPLLRHIGATGKPVILSTGMSTLGEVEEAMAALREAGAGGITLLHCVTEYPAPYDQINLRAMETLRQAFGVPVGYSDHTAGREIAIAAVAMGATIIEKHLTLDCSMDGPDHKASLEPAVFASMVSAIRDVESALGDGRKVPAPCELPNRDIARKSIVAACSLTAGSRIGPGDLALKRPGHGMAPRLLPLLVGRVLRADVAAEDLLDWSHLN